MENLFLIELLNALYEVGMSANFKLSPIYYAEDNAWYWSHFFGEDGWWKCEELGRYSSKEDALKAFRNAICRVRRIVCRDMKNAMAK